MSRKVFYTPFTPLCQQYLSESGTPKFTGAGTRDNVKPVYRMRKKR